MGRGYRAASTRLKRRDVADAEGDVSCDMTIAGKISGLIMLDKFFEAAKSTLNIIYASKIMEEVRIQEPSASVVAMCEIMADGESPEDRRAASWEKEDDDVEDIAVHISFYDPLRSQEHTAETVILGSHTLADVRNSFRCITEYVHREKSFEQPGEGLEASYFYIEGMFYIDQSNYQSQRCAESVVSWADSIENFEPSPFFKWPPRGYCDMGSVRIRSMSIRVNYPYVFSHGGVCNHTIYFRRVYFYSSKLYPRLPRCPFLSHFSLSVDLKCNGCRQNLSSYITVNDSLADTDTALWCRRCFEMFHLNENGAPSHEYDKFYLSPNVGEYLEFERLYRSEA